MKDIIDTSKTYTVNCNKHPLLQKREVCGFTLEQSIDELLHQLNPKKISNNSTSVWVNNSKIETSMYSRCILEAGDIVDIKYFMQGGGDGDSNQKQMGAIVATVALMAVAGPAGAAIAGEGTFGASLATAAIGVVGSLVIGALFAPSEPTNHVLPDATNAYNISGSSNKADPYNVVPQILGRHRVFPKYGANPYVQYIGDESYLNCLFVWGYGPLSLTDLKLGDTDLEDYDEITIETKTGLETDEPTELFPANVNQEAVGITMGVDESSTEIIRTTPTGTKTVTMDFSFPSGLYSFNESLGYAERTLSYYYKAPEDEIWIPLDTVTSYSKAALSREYLNNDLPWGYYITDTITIGGFTFSFSTDPTSTQQAYWDGHNAQVNFDSMLSLLNSSTIPTVKEFLYNGGVVYKVTGSTPTGGSKYDYTVQFSMAAKNPGVLDGTTLSMTGIGSTVTAGSIAESVQVIRKNTVNPVRHSVTYTFAEEGQYDIRVVSDAASNISTVHSVLSYDYISTAGTLNPVKLDNLAYSVVRIRATNQLNGTIQNFNGIAQTIAPHWNSTTQEWITTPTSNPAAMFRLAHQGNAVKNKLEDSSLDLESLQEWSEFCETYSLTCNYVIDTATSVAEISDLITATGMSTSSFMDGKKGVITDKIQETPIAVVTPRNSWGFSVEKTFLDELHAFRCPFNDEAADWLEDERIVYKDGYDETNATLFEELKLPGITSSDQVYKLARYFLASSSLRPEIFSFNMDIENLVVTRGDRLEIQNDTPGIGLLSARVSEITTAGGLVISFKTDDYLLFEDGKSYFVKFRYSDGTFETYEINNDYDSEQEYSRNYIFTLTTPVEDTKLSVDNLAMIGETETITYPVVVKSITPGDNEQAAITAVAYDENIYTAWEGEIPEYTVDITKGRDDYFNTPKGYAMVVSSWLGDERVITTSATGAFTPHLVVNYYVDESKIATNIEVQYKESDSEYWNILMYQGTETSFSFPNVVENVSYDFRVRSYAEQKGLPGVLGTPGAWTYSNDMLVTGTSNVPSDVSLLLLENNRLIWNYPEPPKDFKGFIIKQLGGTLPDWDLGLVISDGFVTSSPFPIDERTVGEQIFMIKAVDSVGNYSDNFAFISADFRGLETLNLLYTIDYSDTWETQGTLEGGVILGDNTLSNETSPGVFEEMTYITKIFSGWKDARVHFEQEVVSVDGWYIEYRKPLPNPFWAGEDDHIIWTGVDTDIFWTSVDSLWIPWTNYYDMNTADPLQFRITCKAGTEVSKINELKLIVDIDDETEFFNDLDITAGGLRVPITKDYLEIRTLDLALQSDVRGGITVMIADKNAELGPLLQVLDINGNDVGGIVDVTIYGVPTIEG